MRTLPRISGAALALALSLVHAPAFAAVNGNIAGTVTDEATGKPLAGVTVTVTSPALQGEQTEFTDGAGRYLITELPPGEYMVRFYFSNIKVERPGVFLQADRTLPVNAALPTQRAKTQTYRIVEKAPTVDVGNTQVQTSVTQDLVRNTPIAGRSYDAVLTLAPGAATDPIGFSFNGATGPENNFLLDGLNITNGGYGLLSAPLSLEFIAETEIITGGYNAEYGRATGGVVNVITKSGSNDFHGGAWFYATPFQLSPETVARSGEAIARRTKLSNAFDFGFDIGGPILKDRIWFYLGFAPTFETTDSVRILRKRLAISDAAAMAKDTYAGDLGGSCPPYIDPALCKGVANGTPGTGPYKTQEIPGTATSYPTNSRRYQYIAKLNFAIADGTTLALHYIGSPETHELNGPLLGGTVQTIDFNGDPSSFQSKEVVSTHDVGLHLISKLAERKLQLDVLAGFHQETNTVTPRDMAGAAEQVFDVREVPLSLFQPNVTDCMPTKTAGGATFSPCPVSNYNYGGVGFVNDLTDRRYSAQIALTYFLRLAGTHALKLGFDFEDNIFIDHRNYTGSRLWEVRRTGNPEIYREFGTVKDNGTDTEKIVSLPDGFTATTKTLNESLYLRDSWNVGFVPGLTINAGLRWEAQQVKDVSDTTQISVNDNLAPRVGFVYDWTQKGRSKIYASYGRFYESIPLDINDRQFSGEGLLIHRFPMQTGACGGGTQAMPSKLNPSACMEPAWTRADLNGGSFAVVSPTLKGQYSNEVVAGLQYDVGLDLVLGAAYVHRDLGRIIEDMSPDGGINYVVANPGDATDAGTVSDLQAKIKATSDPAKKVNLQKTLAVYQAAAQFPKPKRDYNALVLTANKRLSHNFIVLASYTYSRTLGNYPGLFQASNGQLDPNISTQYDLKELLVNRDGPLPNDRPHNLKVTGSYMIPFGGNIVTLGLSFNGLSGRPIEVLGQHPSYGREETFILPRGSGGRTPFMTQFDFHLGYSRQFTKMLKLDIYWDTFNLFNQHTVLNVDDEYTTDFVMPAPNAKPSDLANLKNLSGQQIKVSPNYGNATRYQAPLSMRFGLRVSF